MSTMAYQIIRLTIVYSIVYSGADHRKHQSSALLAFVGGIHWWQVDSPHKGPVTRKMFHLMTSSLYDWVGFVATNPDVAIKVSHFSTHPRTRLNICYYIVLRPWMIHSPEHNWENMSIHMKTSCHGSIFRVTGPLWLESPDHQQRANKSGLWCFL